MTLLGTGERPRGGRQGLGHLVRQIAESEELGAPLPPSVRLPRYARLVLVSDFLEPLESLRASFQAYVATGGRGCLLQIIDPAEEELPYQGRMLFEGMEREGRALIGNVSSIRQRYRSALCSALRRAESACRTAELAARRPPHGSQRRVGSPRCSTSSWHLTRCADPRC